MLGELIGEGRGKITGLRVLPSDGQAPKLEVSFQGTGKILGYETTNLGTYESVLTPSGVFNGCGQGVIMTKDGDVATWTGTGVGKPTGKGMAASWRGSLQYQTASQRLAGLNKIVCVFEHEVDESGGTVDKLFEWK